MSAIRTLLNAEVVAFRNKRPLLVGILNNFRYLDLCLSNAFVTDKYMAWLNYDLQVAGTMQASNCRNMVSQPGYSNLAKPHGHQ